MHHAFGDYVLHSLFNTCGLVNDPFLLSSTFVPFSPGGVFAGGALPRSLDGQEHSV